MNRRSTLPRASNGPEHPTERNRAGTCRMRVCRPVGLVRKDPAPVLQQDNREVQVPGGMNTRLLNLPWPPDESLVTI